MFMYIKSSLGNFESKNEFDTKLKINGSEYITIYKTRYFIPFSYLENEFFPYLLAFSLVHLLSRLQ